MYQAKELFIIQTELIDMKVDMAINQTINRVIEQIAALKVDIKNDIHQEISGLQKAMNERFSSLETRVGSIEHRMIAVETRLGIVHGSKQDIYSRIKDHAFKAGWLILVAAMSYALIHAHITIS